MEKKYSNEIAAQLVWSEIQHSQCQQDYLDFTAQFPALDMPLWFAALDKAVSAFELADPHAAAPKRLYPQAFSRLKAYCESAQDPAHKGEASFHLGKMLQLGLGTAPDRDLSIRFYEQAIACGEVRALVNCAGHFDGDDASEDDLKRADALYEKAFELGEAMGVARKACRLKDNDPMKCKLFMKAAGKGLAYARYQIGFARMFGEYGQPEDIDSAILHLTSAAFGGNAEASHLLGWHYEQDQYRDPIRAFKWHCLSAEQGNKRSMRALGFVDFDIPEESKLKNSQKLRWLKRAALLGEGWSAWRLATFYRDGINCEQDEDLSFKYCEIGARAGIAAAQGRFGFCYWRGCGVQKDVNEAFKWMNLCALQGDPRGLFMLGFFYDWGIGCESDKQEAMRLYLQAHEKGDLDAAYQIGENYYHGEAVAKDHAVAVTWYQRAAAKGHAKSMTRLGFILQSGDVVLPNYKEAAKWFKKAAKLGEPVAMYLLAELYHDGDGVTQSDQKCRHWMSQAAMRDFEPAKKWISEHLPPQPRWLGDLIAGPANKAQEPHPENTDE